MRPYHKALSISIIILLTGIISSLLLDTIYHKDLFLAIPAIILMPVATALLIILMFSYKNRLLIKVVFYGMPVSLLLYFISFTLHFAFLETLSIIFYFFLVLVNLIVHFLRYDLNLIVMTFLIIAGVLFKRFHWPGAGMIVTLSLFISAIFLLVIAFRALRIKDNKYLSGVIFSSCLVLAATCMSFLWKTQHLPGAGYFSMIILPVFIIATLIILLTLPGSNFIEWTRQQKRILLRGLLVPWLFFIYIFTTTLLIPPHNQLKPFFFLKEDTSKVNFFMEDYEVENRNGLE